MIQCTITTCVHYCTTPNFDLEFVGVVSSINTVGQSFFVNFTNLKSICENLYHEIKKSIQFCIARHMHSQKLKSQIILLQKLYATKKDRLRYTCACIIKHWI